jgi:NAD(P)-dependent dehydrogenase (short-subunit alcohol dehydrogenase family)
MTALAGRTALVTGAAGGIGRAIAVALATAGADLALHDREEGAALSAAGSLLKRLGRRDEVAGSVVFLASDAASLYIGQTLSPNGGGVMP